MTLDVLIVALCAIAITTAVIHVLTRSNERHVRRMQHQTEPQRSDRRP